MWYADIFPRYRSKPREVKGGIKAQAKGFGQSWWAKRWIAVLESFAIGGRLGRGRSYARRGQVTAIQIGKGKVTAKVQGSRPKPYDVTIKVAGLTTKEWDQLIKGLTSQAIFTAKLLAGEMPQDIEKLFNDEGLSLFPAKQADLETDCSCPDWSNPCKHVAAVYYLLGEEFDRDPFMLFQLRGLSREELLKRLAPVAGTQKVAPAPQQTTIPSEPLPSDAKSFWAVGSLPPDFFEDVRPPPVAAALPKRLGNFPFWRGTDRFQEVMQALYQSARERGLRAFSGDAESTSAEPAVTPPGRRKRR
jgi:uncharacterized Zn finger protein